MSAAPLKPMTRQNMESLTRQLARCNIDTEKWGIGDAKTVQSLLTETEKGDCTLIESDGKLCRNLSVLYVAVMSDNKILMEKEQVLTDGRTRVRKIPLAEKVVSGENLLVAASRAIKEELEFLGEPDESTQPVSHSFKILEDTLKHVSIENKASASYPNLMCIYNTYMITVTIDSLPETEFASFEMRGDRYQITMWQWMSVNDAKKINKEVSTYFDS